MKITECLTGYYHLLQQLRAEISGQRPAGRRMKTRDDDIWIVSYPKSGNTWTRFLIANLITHKREVDPGNIEQIIPDIYRHSNFYLESLESPRCLKSHEYFDPRCKKVVMIVRDPRDVVVSYYHYQIKRGVLDDAVLLSDYTKMFVQGNQSVYGSWAENVSSWLAASKYGKELMMLKYEDMLMNQAVSVEKIAKFIGITISTEDATKIADKCSFENMRKQEVNFRDSWIETAGTREDILFMRKGAANSWIEELGFELGDFIYDRWGGLWKSWVI